MNCMKKCCLQRLMANIKNTFQNNTANVGSMIRSASAFGIDLIILSDDCCDPYYRQSIRVSVGHIFNIYNTW